MNRNTLIMLQAAGGLSILAYPFVLLANIMQIAATGSTAATSAPWIALSFYPVVWIALYFASWRAMRHGAVGLAFGLSSIPLLCCLAVAGVLAISWIRFGTGTTLAARGIETHTFPTNNALIDTLIHTGEDIQLGHDSAGAVKRAIAQMDAHRDLVNSSYPGYGSPLNVALRDLSVSLDARISGDDANHNRTQLVRALVARGAHPGAQDAVDLRQSWTLRRVLFDGPVTTAAENPLVWRIVTGDRHVAVAEGDRPLVNRPTKLHGTPLYAALVASAFDPTSVWPRTILDAGGQLSPEEQKDPAAAEVLRKAQEH